MAPQKAITPTQQIWCELGSWSLDGVTIHDTHVSGWISPTQLLAVSSNIGAAKIGTTLGEATLYEDVAEGLAVYQNMKAPQQVTKP